MIKVLEFFQIILGIGIVALILLQQRGVSGGAFLGIKTEFFSKKRGLEKYFYYFTWILIAIFVLIAYFRIKF